MNIRKVAVAVVSSVAVKVAPIRWKQFNELRYWKHTKAASGGLSNDHYAHFYTAHFGMPPEAYAGKVLVDIGCGPRGSLEWADMAAERIGVDPLADEYKRLGADRHAMRYIACPAEAIPLPDASADFVFSFNSLDHVDNVEAVIAQVKRITKPGGRFFLIVEVNHPATPCEPHELKPADLLAQFAPEFRCDDFGIYAQVPAGTYASILKGDLLPPDTGNTGWLSASFTRAL